jgi:hypothetical protein
MQLTIDPPLLDIDYQAVPAPMRSQNVLTWSAIRRSEPENCLGTFSKSRKGFHFPKEERRKTAAPGIVTSRTKTSPRGLQDSLLPQEGNLIIISDKSRNKFIQIP